MRIASLIPSATEMLFALGLGEDVAAVTHECDYPQEAETRTRLTRSVISGDLSPGEIDAAVRELTEQGKALYELDEDVLAELEVELIVTQALCPVCAVSYEDVRAVAERLPSRPQVISLDPEALGDVLDDAVRVAKSAGVPDAGERLRSELQGRLDRVRQAVTGAPRPRVTALEWLDPPYVGGHWVPEMVEIAGGEDVLGEPGQRSRTVAWEEVADSSPEVVFVMPCGLYADEALEQALDYRDRIKGLGAERVIAVDAAASFSRPGPRLADGTELLAHLLHPDRLPGPEGVGWRPVIERTPTA